MPPGCGLGAYYYTYARTESAVAGELITFLNALEGLQLEYPVFVDVEANSLTTLGKPAADEPGADTPWIF